MALTTLIFDVDGTLADTERDGHRIAYNRAFAEADLDWEWSVALYGELLQAVSGGKERLRFYVEQYQHGFYRHADWNQRITDLYVAKTRFFADLVGTHSIPLRPGVLRLLREARTAGLRLAIATATNLHNVRALLESNLGSECDWFTCIATGDVVPSKKPAPDIYLHVMERLGVQAEECLGFEDSQIGVRAAHAAGIPVVVTVNEYTRTQDFTGARLVLDHLGEPDQPFTVLAGNVGDACFVDIALLHAIA